jgi:hypothetical protein
MNWSSLLKSVYFYSKMFYRIVYLKVKNDRKSFILIAPFVAC